MNSLQVVKVLNNNVIIALHPLHGEVVVIGKGIGFNRKAKEALPLDSIEKMFILKDEKEMRQYQQLLPQVDEKLIGLMNDVIFYISQHVEAPLNEHIHIALTDHIAFAMRRWKQGVPMHNPFLLETRELYPKEYRIAAHVIAAINATMGVELPEDEIGFVALHINSAISNRQLTEITEHSHLISDLVELIEHHLGFALERDSLNYSRLIRHLKFAVERIRRGEKVEESDKLDDLLKREYPEMYSLAWKLMKVMQQRLHKPVYEAEAIYLTLHLQRLVNKKDYEIRQEP